MVEELYFKHEPYSHRTNNSAIEISKNTFSVNLLSLSTSPNEDKLTLSLKVSNLILTVNESVYSENSAQQQMNYCPIGNFEKGETGALPIRSCFDNVPRYSFKKLKEKPSFRKNNRLQLF